MDRSQDKGASSGSRASAEPSSTVSALTGFDPARIRNRHLQALADLGCNLFARATEHAGIVYLDGKTADEAGSIALKSFATELGRMVVVGNDSEHHAGLAFVPEGTVGEPFAIAAGTRSAETRSKAQPEGCQSVIAQPNSEDNS